MDLILNPTFILLLTFAGLCSFAVLSFIKWRHRRSGAMASTASVLHHDLTKGRFGPFWSFVLAAGKVVGVGIWVVYFCSVLREHFGDHRSEYEKQAQAQLKRLTGDAPEPTAAPKKASDDSLFMDRLNKELASRAQEVANQPSSTARQPGLRVREIEFVNFYGEPWATSASNAPPASTAVGFDHDDVAFIVSLWKGTAHEIDIVRKDGKKLTDQNIRWALGAFGNGAGWRVEARSTDGSANVWTQQGANASLVTGDDGKGVVYLLRISTDEFLVERNKLETP